MHAIRDMLTKKNLSGKDVGRAIIASLANDLANEKKPLFTQEELDMMKCSLTSEKDIADYNEFVLIESRLVLYQALQQGFFQQAQNGLLRLSGKLTQVKQSITTRIALAQLPAMITQQRHEELENKAKHRKTNIMKELKEAIIEEGLISTAGGIAVVVEPRGMEHTPNGHYEPRIVEELMEQVKDYDIYARNFDDEITVLSREELLYPALRQLYAFNAVYDIFADFLETPEIQGFKLDLSFMEKQIESYNTNAQGIIELAETAEREENQTALKARLDSIFKPLDCAAQRPVIPQKETVKANLHALLTTRYTPLELLEALMEKEAR